MRRLAALSFALLVSACPKTPTYPECRNDDDCKEHTQVCVGGFCKECRDDAQCASKPGTICKDNACTAKPQCTQDKDCGAGESCQAGRCVAQAPPPVTPPKAEAPCELKPPHFDFDDATLKPEERTVLDDDWQCLKRTGFRMLTIEGHCDERGTTEYNLALGQRRAKSVVKYLVGLGAEASKLKTISYGKERPVDRGHDEAAWAKNRRAELRAELLVGAAQ